MKISPNINHFINFLIDNIDDLTFFKEQPSTDKTEIVNFLKEISADSPKKSHKSIKIFSDGASRNNPGEAGAGFIFLDEDDTIIFKDKKFLGIKSNNEAEYLALIFALESLNKFDCKVINIFLDSELVVKQIKGVYKVRDSKLQELYSKANNYLKNYNFTISHIPRERNKLADKLANEAIDEKS